VKERERERRQREETTERRDGEKRRREDEGQRNLLEIQRGPPGELTEEEEFCFEYFNSNEGFHAFFSNRISHIAKYLLLRV